MSHVLPLERFADICRKVYFAIDNFNEIDFILSNGYMYFIFCEHAAGSGREDYMEYGKLCERNMFKAFQRLPLLLPSSMEVIAALMLGAFNAVENSKASLAWSFISVASTQCQTLGYHRSPPGSRGTITSLRASQERLFWSVYRLDKGLSLRFGRAPNILDTEITLPFEQDLPRPVRVARIQGDVYEQLYSPAAISVANNTTRIQHAEQLAEQLRSLIVETYTELNAVQASDEHDTSLDPLRDYHLQCDLVCLTSLLTLILRAVPLPLEPLEGSVNNYVTAAREVFDIHHKCMMGIKKRGIGCSMHRKYINWAIVNTPFVPFTILFTRVIQFHDVADLARLKRFTDSLCPDSVGSESITHPHQLYDLLCQAAQLYMRTNALYPSEILPSLNEDPLQAAQASLVDNSIEMLMEHAKGFEESISNFDNLDDWFQGNQQLMSLLDENAPF
uniref:Xylanolytic transcriptional activator regulatory domain-containing protein n=1 Tax=Bionectria ochroleuca TaxID=29856 RepID=A0A8H7N1E8_BIOOC